MVTVDVDSSGFERVFDWLTGLDSRTVNDAGLVLKSIGEHFENLIDEIFAFLFLSDLVVKIGSVERRLEVKRVWLHIELFNNVNTDLLCCRGSQC